MHSPPKQRLGSYVTLVIKFSDFLVRLDRFALVFNHNETISLASSLQGILHSKRLNQWVYSMESLMNEPTNGQTSFYFVSLPLVDYLLNPRTRCHSVWKQTSAYKHHSKKLIIKSYYMQLSTDSKMFCWPGGGNARPNKTGILFTF